MKAGAEIRETVKDAGEKASKKARAAKKRTKAEATDHMKGFVSYVEELVKHVATVSDGEVARIRSKVEGALEGARQVVEDGAQSVNQRARAGADAADDFVRRSPWAAIGIAIAVGTLLGVAARPRR
jgi:ElaB/YqjD/DUF883 family membrane-anchored ribosome-binding protein